MSGPAQASSSRAPVAILSRTACEDFLYHEAALLDEWRLDEWFALFLPGATYEVPTAGAPDDADSAESLFYIADDYFRLRHRIERLNKHSAHAEWPRSDGARLVSNVRVLGADEEGVSVACTFATYRSRADVTDVFFGHHRYVLREAESGLRIVRKRTLLDMSSLRPHGRVSIIL